MKERQIYIRLFLSIALLILSIFYGVTVQIQAFKCPKMTRTELALNSLNSFTLNFKNCD